MASTHTLHYSFPIFLLLFFFYIIHSLQYFLWLPHTHSITLSLSFSCFSSFTLFTHCSIFYGFHTHTPLLFPYLSPAFLLLHYSLIVVFSMASTHTLHYSFPIFLLLFFFSIIHPLQYFLWLPQTLSITLSLSFSSFSSSPLNSLIVVFSMAFVNPLTAFFFCYLSPSPTLPLHFFHNTQYFLYLQIFLLSEMHGVRLQACPDVLMTHIQKITLSVLQMYVEFSTNMQKCTHIIWNI